MTKDAEHFFMTLLAICISFWENCLVKSFVHFLIGSFVFCCRVIRSLCILGARTLSSIWFENIFSQSVCCLFTLLIVFFNAKKFLIWWHSIYFLLLLVLLVSYPGIHAHMQGYEDLPLFSSKSFIALVFIFRWLIHFQLIFIHGVW